jgi:hypothetical protein
MKDRGREDWREDVCSYWMFLGKTEGTRMPTHVVALSKEWVCGRSFAGIAGLNPAGVHGCLSLVNVVCC